MRTLTLAVVLLFACGVAAQAPQQIQELRIQALKLLSEDKTDQARPLLRDAIVAAELHHQPAWQARCMADYARCMLVTAANETDEAAAMAMLGAAIRLAIEIDDAKLERELLHQRAQEAPDLDVLDAELASGLGKDLEAIIIDYASLEDSPEDALPVNKALRVFDDGVIGNLHLAGGRTDEGLKLLTAAAKEAGNLKLPRLQIRLLENALPGQAALELELRALYTARGATRSLAALDVRVAPAKAEGQSLSEWTRRLLRALDVATQADDAELQAAAARALGRLTGSADWNTVASNALARQHWQLVAQAQWAAQDPFHRLDDDLQASLLAARGDPQIDRLCVQLGLIEDPVNDAAKDKFAKALAKALAIKELQRDALLLADVSGRPECAPPILAAMLKDSTGHWMFPVSLEGLCTKQDVPQLLQLAAVKNWQDAAAAAAAELFRLNPDAIETQVRELEKQTDNGLLRPWLLGFLARKGDKDALVRLREIATKGAPADQPVAAGVLAGLGFASGVRDLRDHLSVDKPQYGALMALNRLPRTFGVHLVGYAAVNFPVLAARGYAKRRVPYRAELLEDNNYDVVLFELPQDRREAAICGTGALQRYDQAMALGGSIADLFQWAALHAGMTGAEVDSGLAAAPDDTALTEAARAEREGAPASASLTRTLVLVDKDPCGRARCRITAVARNADIVNQALVVPFAYDYDVDWVASGILGALYKEVMGQIALASLFKKAELLIPGHDPVLGERVTGLDGKPALRFALPAKTGEGLGDDVVISREKWIQGVVRVEFEFIDNRGAISFPVQALEPPLGDKPDLVALQLILDPPMPQFGRPTNITFITRNQGSSVQKDVMAFARLYGRNPQGPDGWRTIFSLVLAARGWQAGEYRVFESRPLLAPGYFMNTYSYLYSAAKGDTELAGAIDADNAIEESNEENNRVSLTLPLAMPDDLALPKAEAEAVEALVSPLADLMAATTMDDLQAAYGRAADIIIPLEHKSPAIWVMGRHLMARYEMKKSNLRARQALADLQRWKAEGTLTRARVESVRATLEQCEQDFFNSGVPVQANALEKARNATLVANNLAGAGDDAATLMRIAGLEVDGPVSEGGGKTLKLLDGAALLLIESDRLIRQGKADAGNLLDAASNFSEGLGISVPGFSNLHRAMLQAEVEYGTKGFEKCADALNVVGELIEKGESKERHDRLAATVGEVDKHLSAGPFNEDSLKNIAKGWIKDLPVVGKLADILFSWK